MQKNKISFIITINLNASGEEVVQIEEVKNGIH